MREIRGKPGTVPAALIPWRRQALPVERAPGGTSLIDVLDRVLDKGVVVDAPSPVDDAARLVVTEIETWPCP